MLEQVGVDRQCKMRVLMLVNWRVDKHQVIPEGKHAANYYVDQKPYWFFKHFAGETQIDVIDTSSLNLITKFEKRVLHFYVIQALRAIPRLRNYDCVVSHGMPSAVIIALWRRLFKTKCKHVVYDIGCFNSAAKSGATMKLMQFVSKSLDGLIYHTSAQSEYYREFYPWISDKSKFIRFGADYTTIDQFEKTNLHNENKYIICVGTAWRDRKTIVEAYKKIHTDVKLRFVGQIVEEYKGIDGIEQIDKVPYAQLIKEIDGALFCVLPLVERHFSYGQMTLLDQMAREKCVVAARVSSLVDYAIDEHSIIFYEPEDVQDCKEKIEQMLQNHEKRSFIEKNAKIYAQKMCSEKKMAIESEAFFRDVVFGNAKGK